MGPAEVSVAAVLKLAVTIVAIALPDCINPTLIGGELFVATGEHPRRRTATFTLGALTVTFLFGLAFALGLGDLLLSLLPRPGATVKYALIIAAGVVLTLGGIGVWIRRASLAKPEHSRGEPRQQASAGLLGASIGGLELLTAFPYFAAIALIVGSGVSDAGKLFLLLLYCAVYGLPLIAIAVLFAVMGDRAESVLRPLGNWLFAHWPMILGPLTAVIGLGILAFGVVELIST
ncbi:MAG: GAP family protein [Solirubrobacterales bacterium]|nr:GAP family protein [Solirubrobacterales bacterium]